MTKVRPFVKGDIPGVADLSRVVFGTGGDPSPRWRDRYQAYLEEVAQKVLAGMPPAGVLFIWAMTVR